MTPSRTHRRRPVLLTLVAVSKLIKSALLITAGVYLIILQRHDVHDTLIEWSHALRLDPEGRHLHAIIEKITGLSPQTLKFFSVGTFVYAAFYLTEGIGLLFDALWAEWLTIITTAGFIPIEVYEIASHFTWIRLVVLAVNAFILVYLIYRLRQRHKETLKSRLAQEKQGSGI